MTAHALLTRQMLLRDMGNETVFFGHGEPTLQAGRDPVIDFAFG